MSDRYHGSAYRGSASARAPPPSYRDDRRYAPRHHPRDDHDYPPYDSRDYAAPASSYYPGGYSERPTHGRRVHKTIPPPRPWDYSRRPPPRTEQERIELEREREAWEAKEEERYKQRMEERERERVREWERYGAYSEGWERERGWGGGGRRRSRSPEARYDQRGSWGRASVGSSEGRERELTGPSAAASADRHEAAAAAAGGGYAARRSSPPRTPSSEAVAAAPSHAEIPDGPSASRYRPDRPTSPPRGPSGFNSTPPTGPRASRGGPPPPPSGPAAFRTSSNPYTPDRDASSFVSPSSSSSARFRRDGPAPSYRGGHPFGRARRDTNPYDHYEEGSSPHETPYSPVNAHHLTAPRLSRTSSSQTSTPAAVASAVASPTTLVPPSAAAAATPRFSAAWHLTPELDAELLALEAQRCAFVSNYVLGGKRANFRTTMMELKDAELELVTAGNRRAAAERALDVAKETADAYSLEENRKDELQRLMSLQMQNSGLGQTV